MKNREIAQSMFVSIATVEAHLTRIYRKLQSFARGTDTTGRSSMVSPADGELGEPR